VARPGIKKNNFRLAIRERTETNGRYLDDRGEKAEGSRIPPPPESAKTPERGTTSPSQREKVVRSGTGPCKSWA